MNKKRPPKLLNVLEKVRETWKEGRVFILPHALVRQGDRQITDPEIEQVIMEGFHEKSKDEWKQEYGAWNYAIRGRTVDLRDLRIAVSFEIEDSSETLLIVTVIEIAQ